MQLIQNSARTAYCNGIASRMCPPRRFFATHDKKVLMIAAAPARTACERPSNRKIRPRYAGTNPPIAKPALQPYIDRIRDLA
jgi:hypothetical protein